MFGLLLDPEENQLRPFLGQPVCVLLKDGSRKVGQFSNIRAGRLILNGREEEASVAAATKKTSRRTKRQRERTPKEVPEPDRPKIQGEFDEFSIPPLGFEPELSSLPRESVPLNSVDSILIL